MITGTGARTAPSVEGCWASADERSGAESSLPKLRRVLLTLSTTPLPGAVEFLRYANSRGVRVFYISNRRESEKQCTAQNLKKVGFPDVSDQTVLVRTDGSSKEPRRQAVATRHRVVLLIGDNLNDFAELFEKSKTIESRLAAVEQNKSNFGTRFIVLPNVMYGAWEEAIYGEGRLTEEQKAEKRRNTLKDF